MSFKSTLAVIAALVSLSAGYAWLRAAPPGPADDASAIVASGIVIPLHFEPSREPGNFVSRGAGYLLELSPRGSALHLARGEAAASRLELSLLDAGASRPVAEQPLAGMSHYFIGKDPARWRTHQRHYARVRYASVYPGIDLLYYGRGRELEYDFIVAPGADPSRIRFEYPGAHDVRIDERGDLRIALEGGELIHRRPVLHQTTPSGIREFVQGAFRLAREAGTLTRTIVSFEVGSYDRLRPLVIDPVLSYATYLGGTGNAEEMQRIVVDSSGAMYVAGYTASSDFPISGGAWDGTRNGADLFVTKINPQGTAIEYSTFVGGTGSEFQALLRVDAGGRAHLAGQTFSTDYPTTPGAAQPNAKGSSGELFVTRLAPDGGALDYSTYVGGSQDEELRAFQIDGAGQAYLYGATTSGDFPVTAGAPQSTHDPGPSNSNYDFFVTKLNATGTAFLFSTYHGGNSLDQVEADGNYAGPAMVAHDDGRVWIVGTTASADLPTTPGAFDTSYNGPGTGNPVQGDACAALFDTVASTLVYSTYLGGSGGDSGGHVAVDAAGNAYVALQTRSADFPITGGAFDTSYNGGSSGDVLLAKLNPAGSALVYATYLGSGLADDVRAIRVEASGAVTVAGNTAGSNFPTAGGADGSYGGSGDGYIARLNAAGNALLYSTFVGGSGSDALVALELDAQGQAYALLSSDSPDALVTTGGRTHAGNGDDYFVKLNATGTAFLDASFVGGSEPDFASVFAIDADENVYIAGTTESTDYPTTAGSVMPNAAPSGGEDGYLAKFSTTAGIPAMQPGVLAFSATAYQVGESAGSLSAMVNRTAGADGAVAVTCTASSAGGSTAVAGSDYTATSVTLNWADGDTAAQPCVVAISADTSVEGNETFQLALGSPTGGAALGSPALAAVTILDDDSVVPVQNGSVQFGAASLSANENGGSVTLTLTRTNGADGAISVSVASGGGSASAGSDYTALAQTIGWEDGDNTAKTVSLALLDDTTDEANETVNITLSAPTGGAALGSPATAVVTIVDDDVTPAPPAQDIDAKGRYGGGALGLPALIVLALLALASRGARAGEDAVAGWYAGLRAGTATSSLSASDIESRLADAGFPDAEAELDDQDVSGALYAGYRLPNRLAFELSYVDLGEYAVSVSGAAPDPRTLLEAGLGAIGHAGRGVGLALSYAIPLGSRFELTPRAGFLALDCHRELSAGSQRLERSETHVQPMAGVTLAWRVSSRWLLGVNWDHYEAGDGHDITAWSASVEYRFGH